jgi:exodeoxyribonuclease-3
MRIATWNVNSVRARQERLFAWLRRQAPDVLCLQELKVEEAKFPRAELAALGYGSAVLGQRTYNGVAILAREPLEDVQLGLADGVDDPQARLIAATVRGVRVASVYCPNGQSVGSEKWAYKLAFMKRLRAWLDRHVRPDQPFALCGDFNVAPEALDVHDPAAWEGETLYHPEARASLADVAAFGLVDTLRRARPGEPGLYSWWDYRMLGFPKNRGLRIDHVLATVPLADRLVGAVIDREERKGEAPSDHAPVVSRFDLA